MKSFVVTTKLIELVMFGVKYCFGVENYLNVAVSMFVICSKG